MLDSYLMIENFIWLIRLVIFYKYAIHLQFSKMILLFEWINFIYYARYPKILLEWKISSNILWNMMNRNVISKQYYKIFSVGYKIS